MATDSLLKKLKPEELLEITTAFKEFDKDNDGVITAQEMHECLERSRIAHASAEVDAAMKDMDRDRNGTVSFSEYLDFMAHSYAGKPYSIPAETSSAPKQPAKK